MATYIIEDTPSKVKDIFKGIKRYNSSPACGEKKIALRWIKDDGKTVDQNSISAYRNNLPLNYDAKDSFINDLKALLTEEDYLLLDLALDEAERKIVSKTGAGFLPHIAARITWGVSEKISPSHIIIYTGIEDMREKYQKNLWQADRDLDKAVCEKLKYIKSVDLQPGNVNLNEISRVFA